jgi:hypothetical protein
LKNSFLLTLHSKFCKEERWRCWKIHVFFSWSNSYRRPAQVKKMKVCSILILWNTWKWFQQWFSEIHEIDFRLVLWIHESDFSNSFVEYMKVISTMVLWNTWKWFQISFVKYMKVISTMVLWNTWKWFQQWFYFPGDQPVCEIHESDFSIDFFVKYMKVISALALFSRWQTHLWNTWKWF